MLTHEMIEFLLDELSWNTIVHENPNFPYRVQRQETGYQGGIAGKTQAALSVMREAKRVTEGDCLSSESKQ